MRTSSRALDARVLLAAYAWIARRASHDPSRCLRTDGEASIVVKLRSWQPVVGRAPRDVPGVSLCRSEFTWVRERSTGSRVGERLGWPCRKQYGPLGLWDGVQPMALRAGNRRGR